MLTSLKLFFGTPLGKNLLLGIALALVVSAVYQWGSHNGYDSGHTAGVKAGKEGLQPTIDHLEDQVDLLTTKINTDTKERNKKIGELEIELNEQVIATISAQVLATTKRDKIIDKYLADVPKLVQDSCGLTVKEIEVINELINTQIVDPQLAVPEGELK